MPQTALFSVHGESRGKELAAFAHALRSKGWEFMGSDGTTRFFAENKVPCRNISEIVGSPILGHRVVTLSREIHAGILADLTKDEDLAKLKALGIAPIELICVSLYPLEKALANKDRTIKSIRENLDVGGVALLHAAAKSGRIVVSSPAQYAPVLDFIRSASTPKDRDAFICKLAADAEALAADYLNKSAEFFRSYGKR